jgi:type VI secretion system protein ImpL
MSSLLGLLRNRFVVLGSGFVLLISLAFMLGAWMGWPMTTRLYIVIGILVVSVLAAVVELVRSQRSASNMEDSMRWQAEQQVEHSRPDKKREIEEMKQRFEDAVDRLKRSKLGRGRRGSAALHALPWYLFIGPPSSGKTTAIVNSGLNFPVGTDRIRGVGGTRNCDWFFSDQAILLDTAGRYVTETDDEKEWHTFLDMLRDNRPGRPINGVVVAISVADLLDADPYDLEWHATTIRRRIVELGDRLGVRFPVYLVFTKCDLIRGFADFFRDLTQKEREQIWGCTFEEPEDERAPRNRFAAEFDRLSDALADIRLTRLHRSMKREARNRVFVFPVEFAQMKETLADFVGHLFQPNPYESEPELRGFYFTSGTQEGRPIDRVIRNVAERFELPAQNGSEPEPAVETKSYFLKDLFTQVIIPDQYRVERTQKSVQTGRWKRAGALTAGVAALALFAVGVTQAGLRSLWDLQDVEDAAAAARPVEWQAAGPVGLPELSNLLDEVRTRSDPDHAPSFRWGLARHEELVGPARRLHTARMEPLVRRHLRSLERRLDAATRRPVGTDRPDSLRREAYADLRALLLLTQEQSRLADSTEQQFLTRHLAHVAGTPRWTTGDAGAYRDHLSAFVIELAARPQSPFSTDERSVDRVRARLLDVASLSPYDRLRTQGITTLRPLSLHDLLPRDQTRLFATNPEIPGLFTQAGWGSYMEPNIEAERTESDAGDWVLGVREPASRSANGEATADRIEQEYWADYLSAWQRFLGQVRLREPGSLRETAALLQRLGNPQTSPILYFLAQVAHQTDFAGPPADRTVADAVRSSAGGEVFAGADTSNVQRAAHPVSDRFAWLHALRPRQAVTDPAPELTGALGALQSTGRLLDGLVGDPQATVDAAAAVLEGNGGELARSRTAIEDGLFRFDESLRRELFERPHRLAWRSMLVETQTHLNRRWREDVSRPFETRLARAFPFQASAPADAPLLDVETFFAPETGTLDAFLDTELRPFYDVDRRRARSWDGLGLSFSAETLRFLEQADRLQTTLFEGDIIRLPFELRPDFPERMPSTLQVPRVRISLHGVSDTYTMGTPYWFDAVWPGRPGASVLVEERRLAIPEKRYDGDWALLRLLADARIRPATSTQSRVSWAFEDAAQGRYRIVVSYDLRARRGMDLFADPLGFFRISVPTTLG